MLLNKCAPLRCSAAELIELPELRDRIKKFNRTPEELENDREEERKHERA